MFGFAGTRKAQAVTPTQAPATRTIERVKEVKVPFMYRDAITHQPIPNSSPTTDVIRRALVGDHAAGRITDIEYRMAYAETCEPGREPQAFGGGPANPDLMDQWKNDIFRRNM